MSSDTRPKETRGFSEFLKKHSRSGPKVEKQAKKQAKETTDSFENVQSHAKTYGCSVRHEYLGQESVNRDKLGRKILGVDQYTMVLADQAVVDQQITEGPLSRSSSIASNASGRGRGPASKKPRMDRGFTDRAIKGLKKGKSTKDRSEESKAAKELPKLREGTILLVRRYGCDGSDNNKRFLRELNKWQDSPIAKELVRRKGQLDCDAYPGGSEAEDFANATAGVEMPERFDTAREY